MDLTTSYLGLKLSTPLVPSASCLSESVDNIKRMEDAGAAAVVMHSLFEEQIRYERYEFHHYMSFGSESYPEALSYMPEPPEFHVGPEAYLDHIAKAKQSTAIPIIASLNGSTLGGWTEFAKLIQEAGADAVELNLYNIPTDPELAAADIEKGYLDVVSSVKAVVQIPVAVKLSPFFTNFAHMSSKLDQAGVDGLVLFNRFYQPDIELESMEVAPNLLLSTPMEMRLPLRWIGILFGRIGASLAATTGIHHGADVLKFLCAGADVTMLCSVLLRRGIPYIRTLEKEVAEWLEEHEYQSVAQLKGCLSQQHSPDPGAFERAQYVRALTTAPPELF